MSSGLVKFESRCPRGYHKDEKSGRCVDANGNVYTPTTTTERPAQRFRTGMSSNPRLGGVGNTKDVEGSKGKGEDFEEKPKFQIPEEDKKKIQQNIRTMRSFIANLTSRSTMWKKLLVPVTTSMIAYDMGMKQANKYREKANTKQQKKSAEMYAKTMNEILETIPDIDLDDISPDTAKKIVARMKDEQQSRLDELRELAKKKGKKSMEYAQYRAYADFIKSCNDKQDKIESRLLAQRRMEQLKEQRSRFSDTA